MSLLEVRAEDDLLFVTLNDPARANALSPALAAELTTLYRRDLRAEGVRPVLLAGAGRHFCAGADLEHLQSLQSASALDNRLDSGRLRDLFEAILRQEALTLALVPGSCVAGAAYDPACDVNHDGVVNVLDIQLLLLESLAFSPAKV